MGQHQSIDGTMLGHYATFRKNKKTDNIVVSLSLISATGIQE